MQTKRYRHFWQASFLALFMMLFLVACGQKPQQKLLGRWEELSLEHTVFEFFQDGTVTLKPKQKGGRVEEISAKWIVLEDGRLKLDIVMLGTAVTSVFKLRFEGPGMVLTDDKGKDTLYKKLG